VSFIAQVATTLAADVRSFADDLGRGFMSGGIAGAAYVVISRSRGSDRRQALVVSACGLAGVGIVLLVRLIVRLV